jgi:CMP-N,N'-diacetyllegionaminic acid synthase
VYSVTEPERHPLKTFLVTEDGWLKCAFGEDAPFAPRQSLPRAAYPNGAIYWFSREDFVEQRRFPMNRIVAYFMPPDRSLDIDSPADLAEAERLLSRQVKQVAP